MGRFYLSTRASRTVAGTSAAMHWVRFDTPGTSNGGVVAADHAHPGVFYASEANASIGQTVLYRFNINADGSRSVTQLFYLRPGAYRALAVLGNEVFVNYQHNILAYDLTTGVERTFYVSNITAGGYSDGFPAYIESAYGYVYWTMTASANYMPVLWRMRPDGSGYRYYITPGVTQLSPAMSIIHDLKDGLHFEHAGNGFAGLATDGSGQLHVNKTSNWLNEGSNQILAWNEDGSWRVIAGRPGNYSVPPILGDALTETRFGINSSLAAGSGTRGVAGTSFKTADVYSRQEPKRVGRNKPGA